MPSGNSLLVADRSLTVLKEAVGACSKVLVYRLPRGREEKNSLNNNSRDSNPVLAVRRVSAVIRSLPFSDASWWGGCCPTDVSGSPCPCPLCLP
jgi:hypothetical protein